MSRGDREGGGESERRGLETLTIIEYGHCRGSTGAPSPSPLPAPGEEKVQVQEQEPGARWPGAG